MGNDKKEIIIRELIEIFEKFTKKGVDYVDSWENELYELTRDENIVVHLDYDNDTDYYWVGVGYHEPQSQNYYEKERDKWNMKMVNMAGFGISPKRVEDLDLESLLKIYDFLISNPKIHHFLNSKIIEESNRIKRFRDF